MGNNNRIAFTNNIWYYVMPPQLWYETYQQISSEPFFWQSHWECWNEHMPSSDDVTSSIWPSMWLTHFWGLWTPNEMSARTPRRPEVLQRSSSKRTIPPPLTSIFLNSASGSWSFQQLSIALQSVLRVETLRSQRPIPPIDSASDLDCDILTPHIDMHHWNSWRGWQHMAIPSRKSYPQAQLAAP